MKLSFEPIPGVKGRIVPNGSELIITHGNFDLVKKRTTVTDKKVVFAIRRLKLAMAKFERRIEKLEEEYGPDTREGNALLEVVADKKRELAALPPIKREYWADRGDGSLSLPPGFWFLCETIEGDGHLNTEVTYEELPVVEGKEPREYQIDVVQSLLRFKRASTVMPTGTGKTIMLAMIIQAMLKAGKRVCIVEPTIELVEQTAEFFRKYFDGVAALGGTNRFKPGCMVLVSTIQSALKHIDIFDCVLVDEFHHSAADTYDTALYSAITAEYFYGFTACPNRADGMSIGIHSCCGPIVYEKTTRWAIDNGFLCKPRIVILEIGGIGQYDSDTMAVKAYKWLMGHRKVLDTIHRLIKKSSAKDHSTMVLFKTVMAGEATAKYSKKKGLEYQVASAKYRHPLRQFRKKESKLLVSNTALCGEGVDVPSINSLINCCQSSSENMIRQVIGRGLRTAPGKTELIYVDIVTTGYAQFESAAQTRRLIYEEFCDDIKVISL